MVKLNTRKTKIIRDDLKAQIETERLSRNDDRFRSHLGSSLIGDSCELKLKYNFFWTKKPTFKPNILRLFETGQLQEQRISKELRTIGATVLDVNPETGKQWRFSEHFGHFGGSMDAVIEIDGVWYVGEYKTHNDKSFKELLKKGVEKSKFQHFAQMQTYMRLSNGIEKALYFAVNKNNDEIYIEEVEYVPELAESLSKKAERIIFGGIMPGKLSTTPDYFECKWCDFSGICHGEEIPLVNCRTCKNFSIIEENKFCSLRDEKIAFEDEVQGCSTHIFNPDFMPGSFEFVGEDVDGKGFQTVQYKRNGKFYFNGFKRTKSIEFKNLEALENEDVKKVKEVFPGATVTSVTGK